MPIRYKKVCYDWECRWILYWFHDFATRNVAENAYAFRTIDMSVEVCDYLTDYYLDQIASLNTRAKKAVYRALISANHSAYEVIAFLSPSSFTHMSWLLRCSNDGCRRSGRIGYMVYEIFRLSWRLPNVLVKASHDGTYNMLNWTDYFQSYEYKKFSNKA